ncbi:hypothetical protein FHS18_003908 [Paenibacillus phyllosphaerae]|uniref:Uncharacterized protein n=1 Tax=Paenibacillus phyllosphaerae TaxID=274593 RepID=A0A7W5AZV0_9BACL|nr:hypothetical protein [Paenibacillus phyllosphaerae]
MSLFWVGWTYFWVRRNVKKQPPGRTGAANFMRTYELLLWNLLLFNYLSASASITSATSRSAPAIRPSG